MNKGQFMKLVYSEEELRQIDSAIPIELAKEFDTFSHVMNYNEKGAFGDLQDMYVVALQRGISLPPELLEGVSEKRRTLYGRQ